MCLICAREELFFVQSPISCIRGQARELLLNTLMIGDGMKDTILSVCSVVDVSGSEEPTNLYAHAISISYFSKKPLLEPYLRFLVFVDEIARSKPPRLFKKIFLLW